MNISAKSVALWLTISGGTNAFTTTHTQHSSSTSVARTYTQHHISPLHMLLKKDKFDAVVSTKRNKDLGYDDRTGRFFEMQQSSSNDNGGNTVAIDEPVIYTDVLTADAQKAPTWQQVDSNDDTPIDATDIPPPMPEAGFVGMNITGEINGVKMTSSSETIKRKEIKDKIDKQLAAEEMELVEEVDTTTTKNSLSDVIANSGAVSAAAMATAAVNAAVSMKSLSAPDVQKSYVSLDSTSTAIDEEGLPLVYDKDLIETYWKKERGALNQRWSYFVGKAVPFLTRLVTLFIAEGEINERHIPSLSRQARVDLQDLGPTFIKAGQMMSVRPDVLPQATLDELTKLQDSVQQFPTEIAVQQIESELGGPLGQFFTSISEEPVAAASLAQVYIATLNDGKDTKVAVKVQRPNIRSVVSKDLYVLRRAAEVFQGLIERFAPQQKTNYVALLNEFSIGFYTELDFQNEGKNQNKLRNNLIDAGIKGITVPKVYDNLTTRRVLVSEWMDGKKLSECPKDEIREITAIAQEAFLMQLFETGFFHAVSIRLL